MSNLLGSEPVTRLNSLPAVRSNVINTVSSSAPERKATYRPSAEIVTPYIWGRRANRSMGCGAAATIALAAHRMAAPAQRSRLIVIGVPLVGQTGKYNTTLQMSRRGTVCRFAPLTIRGCGRQAV